MRICILSFHCSPFSLPGGNGAGGMNIYLKELTAALTRNYPVEVDIFTRSHKPEHQGITQVDDSTRIIHLPAGPEKPIQGGALVGRVTEFTSRLRKFIRRNHGYDVIYSHYWLSGLIGESLKKALNIPHVFTFHTLEFLKKRALEDKRNFCRILAEQSLAEGADVIISSSDEEKKHLTAEYRLPASKIAVIYPGVNREVFFPERMEKVDREMKRGETDTLYLYAGRIEPIKGLNNLLEAWDLIKKNQPRTYERSRLLVIGGGEPGYDFAENPEMQRLQRCVQEKGLQDRINFLGSRQHQALRTYFTAADALIMPSLYESFGLVVVEALACGTPVIVSRIGKIKSIVRDGENGFSFSPNNPAALADLLVSFPEKRKRLHSGERIRSGIINKFSWPAAAAKTYSVMCGLTHSQKGLIAISSPGESPQPV